MKKIRKLISVVESTIKQVDPETIVQGTFYDEVSDRLFVTVVKGSRKKIIALLGHDLDDDREKINRTIERYVKRLEEEPIG